MSEEFVEGRPIWVRITADDGRSGPIEAVPTRGRSEDVTCFITQGAHTVKINEVWLVRVERVFNDGRDINCILLEKEREDDGRSTTVKRLRKYSNEDPRVIRRVVENPSTISSGILFELIEKKNFILLVFKSDASAVSDGYTDIGNIELKILLTSLSLKENDDGTAVATCRIEGVKYTFHFQGVSL